MKEVYDPIRRRWVAATPEEIVRQRWLYRMVHELHFPKQLVVVERELKMLPHLQNHSDLPARRIDILSFEKNLKPLLLIECKELLLSEEAIQQALAYNTFVGAQFVAIVNESQIRLRGATFEIDRLPSYKELLHA